MDLVDEIKQELEEDFGIVRSRDFIADEVARLVIQ